MRERNPTRPLHEEKLQYIISPWDSIALKEGTSMKKSSEKIQTVRKSVQKYNSWIIVLTIAICAAVNIFVAKIFWESLENNISSISSSLNEKVAEDLMQRITIENQTFLILAITDAAICIFVMVLVNLFFSARLTKHFQKPLDELEKGAKRIQEGDFSVPVSYTGDREFEDVCHSFNSMQQHLQSEREKNAKYEKARMEMVSGISHDLRTPLTAISGTVKGLLDGVADTPELQKKFLTAAYRRTQEMNRLLEELLDLSRLETGHLSLQLTRIDLGEFLREYANRRNEDTSSREVRFLLSLPEKEDPLFAELDREQMKRILDNLFGNSCKYTDKDVLEIRIELRRKEPGMLEMLYADNGPGVPEDKLDEIFKEFFRLDESRSRQEGSGLGLYIVRTLTEAMGGTVWAENRDGLAILFTWKEAEASKEPALKGEKAVGISG